MPVRIDERYDRDTSDVCNSLDVAGMTCWTAVARMIMAVIRIKIGQLKQQDAHEHQAQEG